jgi:hypothetical protein
MLFYNKLGIVIISLHMTCSCNDIIVNNDPLTLNNTHSLTKSIEITANKMLK